MAGCTRSPVESDQYINEFGRRKIALRIEVDTGPRLMPVRV